MTEVLFLFEDRNITSNNQYEFLEKLRLIIKQCTFTITTQTFG